MDEAQRRVFESKITKKGASVLTLALRLIIELNWKPSLKLKENKCTHIHRLLDSVKKKNAQNSE